MRAAATWGHLGTLALANEMCPRCSAPVDQAVKVCDHHDSAAGKCETCDSRFAITIVSECTNCIYTASSSAFILVPTAPDVLAFVGDHGLNTTSRGIEWGWDFDEEIISVDPFEARLTFSLNGETITVTVDDGLNVIETTREESTTAD